MKKFRIEYLIYILILISPLLDALSFLINKWLPNISVSPTLILRPIIPAILLVYIFIKDKSERKKLIIGSIIYLIYGIVHLLITNKLLYPISVGNIFQELTYVFNYTYMVYVLYILFWFNKNNKIDKLNKYLIIALVEYLVIIYFSIITKTSSTTYLTGIGYKSYFISGNSLCTILLMLLSILLINFKEHKILYSLMFILLGYFLIFLVGMRTGLLGFGLLTISYIGLCLLFKYKKDKKKLFALILIGIVLVVSLGVVSTKVLKRRSEVDEESKIIDVNTKKYGHTTGDTSMFVYRIKNLEIEKDYMSSAQGTAYMKMYKLANANKIRANNNRIQQLIYNSYRVIYEHNIWYILFGNGYITNYGEMTLEMETIAILLNFGIFGFVLYLIPFIILLIKYINKNIKKLTVNKTMLIITILLTLGLGTIAGYVFFSSTCMLILSSIYCILYKED